MATVDGLTKAAMEVIRDNVIVDASIDGSGHLILTRYDGTPIDVGNVIGPTGPEGPEGFRSIQVVADEASRPTADLFDGYGIWQEDVESLFFYNGTDWFMPQAGLPHTSATSDITGTTPCTSDVYVSFDHPIVVNFLKKRADAHVIVEYHGGVRNDNVWGEYAVGVLVEGPSAFSMTYDIQKGFGDMGPKSGLVFIDGLPVGDLTFTLMRKVANGQGTVYDGQHADNLQVMTVTETF